LATQTPTEQTPDREGLFAQIAHDFSAVCPVLLIEDNADQRLAAWEVAQGRLAIRSVLAAGSSRHLGFPRVSPDGRAILLFDECQFRRRTKDDDVVTDRNPRESKTADAYVRPCRLSLFDSSEKTVGTPYCQSCGYESGADEETQIEAVALEGQGVAWSLDGKLVRVWDLRDKPFTERCTLKVRDGYVSKLALSPGLRWAAVLTSEKDLHLWDLSGAKPEFKHKLPGVPAASRQWLGFLGDDQTLAAEAGGRITLWDLSGRPQCKFTGKTLDELTPAERERFAAAVRKHPPNSPLPDGWRLAFIEGTHRLRARVTESGVVVTREDRDGRQTQLVQWSPPVDVLRTQFSGDGRHLIVGYANGTVEVVRLDPAYADDRLLAACDAILQVEPDNVPARIERAKIHARRGDHKLAVQDFSNVLQFQPKNAAALHQRGLSRIALREYAAAREDFAAALRIDPTIHRR
jgi:hypothetical protein